MKIGRNDSCPCGSGKLRFKADDGSEFPEWEERTFGDIWKRIAVKNDGSFGGDKIISVANMKWAPKDDVRDDYLKTYNLLPSNAIAFEGNRNNSYSYGRFVLNDIGDGIVSHVFVCFEPIVDIIPAFWKEYIHAECVMGKILRKCTKSSTMMHDLVVPDFLKQIISVPSLSEQRKISDLLSAVDDVITAQEAEVAAWEKRKKGVMQKLFSQEVRFKADDGSEFPEWEEKRLGEVTSRVTRRNNNMISDIPLTISGVYGLIDQRKYFNKIVAASDLSNYYLLKNGEFAYNRSSSVGYDFGAIKRLDSCEYGAVSTLYVCFSILDENDVCSDYLRVYFDSNIWNKYAASVCAEGARNHGLLNISVNDFFDMPVYIPSLPEQKRIAECLSALDEVITLTKKELSAWKEFKKGLLQQMFV